MKFQYRCCPNCGSWRCAPVGKIGTRELGVKEDFPAPVRCLNCSLVYLSPVMSEQLNNEFYSNNAQEEFITKAGISIDQDVDTKRRVEYVEKQSNHGVILDIGCGNSNFISSFDGATGIDISESRIKKSLDAGLNVGVCSVFDYKKRADTVTLFHVLEHIIEPIEFLNRIKSVLCDDGQLIIEVPVKDDILVNLPSYKKFYYQLAHCTYFTQRTLCGLINKCGFSVCKIKRIQRYSLDNHLHWLIFGKPGKIKIPKIFNVVYSRIIKTIGLNDTVTVVCKKVKT